MNRFNIIKILIALITSTLLGCNSSSIDETATRGNIKISVDDSYKLIMDTEIFTFTHLYKNAKINVLYKNEKEIINDLINDSVRLVVTNKKLSKSQEDYLLSKSIIPKTTVIAYDALALIVNNNNPDSLIAYDDIKLIFKGSVNKWYQINNNSKLNNISVVFDNINSSNTRYISEKYELKGKFPKNCYALNSNEEVISFVEKNPNAIGMVSVNWLSDKDDSLTINFLKRVKVVAVGSTTNSGSYFKPYQANIADGSYPFIRDVYMISRESFYGLGSGFISFVAGDKGQRIILKSGLVPANVPIRLVKLNN